MAERYLAILEVSQKQSYIFGYKRLQNNIIASDVIRYVTCSEFFRKIAGDLFEKEKNLVYDGGGHTILEFETEKAAKDFVTRVTEYVLRNFQGLELFAKVKAYEDDKDPAENEELLIAALEEKKSMRRAAFHQGKFGIEASSMKRRQKEAVEKELEACVREIQLQRDVDSSKYRAAVEFEHLGGVKDESNFIAVVHIDGNLMGRRVSALKDEVMRGDCSWENYKRIKQLFSRKIDDDFKAAYADMTVQVEKEIEEGSLAEKLNLGTEDEKYYFPVRRIITAGDDVCFVTEGRIGLECARLFLESIYQKINEVDHKNYSACAGVAIVHQKYPFYRAYELAEELCSNAKRYIAGLAADKQGEERGIADVCAIDWHIEYGEMANGLPQIRKQYLNEDGYRLEARPYIICGDSELTAKDPKRSYQDFCRRWEKMNAEDAAAKNKLKLLRSEIKKSESEAERYVKFQCIEKTVYTEVEKELFCELQDKKKHALIFDALELMDTFIPLGGQQ